MVVIKYYIIIHALPRQTRTNSVPWKISNLIKLEKYKCIKANTDRWWKVVWSHGSVESIHVTIQTNRVTNLFTRVSSCLLFCCIFSRFAVNIKCGPQNYWKLSEKFALMHENAPKLFTMPKHKWRFAHVCLCCRWRQIKPIT